MLDLAQALVVEIAANYIAGQLFSPGAVRVSEVRVRSDIPAGEGSLAGAAGQFNHVGYKVSVVRLGVVDYQAHQRRVLALQLPQQAQIARFASVRDYLRDEKLRVKLADMAYSQAVTSGLEPDDLFTLEYLSVPTGQLPTHCRNLIQISGARVFDDWDS